MRTTPNRAGERRLQTGRVASRLDVAVTGLALAACAAAAPAATREPLHAAMPPPGASRLCQGTLAIGLQSAWNGPSFNLGDQAVSWALVQSLRARCPASTIECHGCVAHAGAPPFPLGVPFVPRSWPNVSAVFVLATDVIDGRYERRSRKGEREWMWIRWAREAAERHVPFTVVAFSYSSPSGKIASFPETACLRPRSSIACDAVHSLHTNATLHLPALAGPRAKVRQSRDIAFLIRPDPAGPPPAEASWLANQRAKGSLVLGVNLFLYHVGTGDGGELSNMRDYAALFAQELCAFWRARPRSALLLIPHDFRPGRLQYFSAASGKLRKDYRDEVVYLHDVLRRLNGSCPRLAVRLFNDGKTYAPTQSSALLGSLDGVVSGLMHLLILSAARGTPGLGLASQDKFGELARDLYPADVAARHVVANFTQHGGLSAAMLRFVENVDESREHLGRALPHVRALALRNLDAFAAHEDGRAAGSPAPPHASVGYPEAECRAGVERCL